MSCQHAFSTRFPGLLILHSGVAFEDVSGRLFPVIGLGQHTQIKVNFGRKPFKYAEYKKERDTVERRRTVGITRRRTHKDMDSVPPTPI